MKKLTPNEKYRKEKPWVRHYFQARRRCLDKKHWNFKWYGGRGIRCFLTVATIRELWYRDAAYNLHKPTLDRIDNDGPYTFENCRFIPAVRNAQIGAMRRHWKEEQKAKRVIADWNV